jgi:hypothetical protein
MILCGMLDFCRLIVALVIDLFRPRAAVEAEIPHFPHFEIRSSVQPSRKIELELIDSFLSIFLDLHKAGQSRIASTSIATGLVACSPSASSRPAPNELMPLYCQTFDRVRPC